LKLREIGRLQLAEELQEIWRLSFSKCEQQNLASTYDKFLEHVLFIFIHIADLSPNHGF
jgi:hypothetical protein